MPKALIIGIDLSFSSNPATILSHERTVKSNFDSNSPSGWTSEILMHTNTSAVANESNVVAIVNSGTNDCSSPFDSNNTQSNIMCWVSQKIGDYDLVILSYDLDGYYGLLLSEIINAYDTPLFMPMPNTDSTNTLYKKSNIVYVGGGVSSNVRGKGQKIECYDDTSSGATLTSFTVPTVAGKFASLLSTLTVNQSLKALRYSCDNFSSGWSTSNGYGKVPDTIPMPSSYEVEPIQSLLVFVDNGDNLRVHYTEFYNDNPDSIRIYVDDVLFYDGNGTSRTQYGWGGYGEAYKLLSARFKRLIFDATDFEAGEKEFKIVAVKSGVESRVEDYNKVTVSVPDVSQTPEPSPEPEPDVGDETPVEDEEEEQPPVLPNPTTPTATRLGSTITVTPNETSTTLKIFRKTKVNDSFVEVDSTTESTYEDEIDETKNYIYAIKLANSETESALSEPVYVRGKVQTAYAIV